jgi:biopolymer transport protein ExbB
MLRVIIANGGLILIPIALTSIAALTVVIERLWRLLPLRRRFAETRARCHEALLRGQPLDRAAEGDDQLARVFRAGIAVREHGPDTVRAVALDAAQREVPGLERGLGVVLAASQVAPLLGLLGTASGLVQAFQAASHAEQVTMQLLAGGVYQALSATVAGLLVAIPAFLAYVGVSAVAARLVDQLEHAATDLPVLLAKVK